MNGSKEIKDMTSKYNKENMVYCYNYDCDYCCKDTGWCIICTHEEWKDTCPSKIKNLVYKHGNDLKKVMKIEEPLTKEKQVLITVEEMPLLSGHNIGFRNDDVEGALNGLESDLVERGNEDFRAIEMIGLIRKWFPVFNEE